MTSKLILIRHAKPEGGSEYTDATRPLSEAGRSIQGRMAEHLQAEGVAPNTILCSPLPRAQETAEILGKALGVPVEVEPALGLDFDVTVILERIPPSDSDQTLMIVGHEPSMSSLSQHLVDQRFLPAGLKKSAAVIVEFDKKIGLGKGRLVAHFDPGTLGID